MANARNCTLRYAATWIALNDDTDVTDAEEIAGFVSVILAADMLGVSPTTVGNAIAEMRATWNKTGWPL